MPVTMNEGWRGGEASWRAYYINASHGQRVVRIGMPWERWHAMTPAQRDAWCKDARRRAKAGTP